MQKIAYLIIARSEENYEILIQFISYKIKISILPNGTQNPARKEDSCLVF